MIITYDKNDTTNIFPDGTLEQGVLELIRKGKDFTLCQELAVMAVRVLVLQGEIKHDAFLISYVDPKGDWYLIRLDSDGRVLHWPDGFGDLLDRLLDSLLMRYD